MTTTKPKLRYKISVDVTDDAYCCGVYTGGEFDLIVEDLNDDWNSRWPGENHTAEEGWSTTKSGAAKLAIAEMITDAGERPIMLWFKRQRDYTGKVPLDQKYDCDELRQVVKHKKGVVKLGTFINPGTKNHIDGYMLTAHATKGDKIE